MPDLLSQLIPLPTPNSYHVSAPSQVQTKADSFSPHDADVLMMIIGALLRLCKVVGYAMQNESTGQATNSNIFKGSLKTLVETSCTLHDVTVSVLERIVSANLDLTVSQCLCSIVAVADNLLSAVVSINSEAQRMVAMRVRCISTRVYSTAYTNETA